MQARTEGTGDALLVVDVLSDYRFEDGPRLLRQVRTIITPLVRLRARARASGVPVVYANDNFGRWRSSFDDVDARIRAANPAAWRTIEPLRPGPRDYVVLKPRHSAFYCTPLELLLQALDVRRLVLTGVSATSCIWATAADAHGRGFELVVPGDAIADPSPKLTRSVLALVRTSFGARTPRCRGVRLRPPRAPRHPAG